MKNKSLAVLMSAVLSVAALSFGQTSSGGPAASTPPTAVAVQGSPWVEVFAFTPVGEAGNSGWIGQGIQESLQGQVSSTGASLVMSPAATPPTPAANTSATASNPIAIAKAAGCNLAVVGTFQVNGGQIRANGHVIDVNTGATVGGFDATGKQDDLFKVEDALGAELTKLLPAKVAPIQPVANATATANQNFAPVPASAPATDQVIQQPTVTYLTPVQTYTPPAAVTSNYVYPDSFAPTYYGYSDPSAYYAYPYYGVDGVYIGGFYGGYYGGRYGNYYGRGGHYGGGYHGGYGSGYAGVGGGHVSVGGGHVAAGAGGHGGGHR